MKLLLLFAVLLAQASAPVPHAGISGRVVTDGGQPLRDASIQLYRLVYLDGVLRWMGVFRTPLRTNELGEFRAEPPAAGRYFLSAIAPGQQSIPRYYPGTLDSSKAEPIEFKNAGDVRLADTVFTPAPTFVIHGRLILPEGIRPRSAVFAVRRLGDPQMNIFPVRAGIDGDPGRFEVRVPTAGTYGLGFRWITEDADYFGKSVVEVRNSDVEGVTIPAIRGGRIAVRALLDTKPVAVSQLYVDPEDKVFLPPIPRKTGEGAFTLQGVYATGYKVGVEGVAPDLYLSRIRFNGLDSLVPAFTPAETELDGTLDLFFAKGSPIKGNVTHESGIPVKGAIVAMIPGDRSRHDLYYSIDTDGSGAFQLEGVAPGRYTVLAWDDIPAGAFLNSDFLKKFEGRGQEIVVEGESPLELSVKVIRTDFKD